MFFKLESLVVTAETLVFANSIPLIMFLVTSFEYRTHIRLFWYYYYIILFYIFNLNYNYYSYYFILLKIIFNIIINIIYI